MSFIGFQIIPVLCVHWLEFIFFYIRRFMYPSKYTSKYVICIQGRGKVWKSGMLALCGGHNLPLLVEIGLTDLPKSWHPRLNPRDQSTYEVQIVNTKGQLISEDIFLNFKSPKQQKMGQIKKQFIRVYFLVFITIEFLIFFFVWPILDWPIEPNF